MIDTIMERKQLEGSDIVEDEEEPMAEEEDDTLGELEDDGIDAALDALLAELEV
jgi:hypothetical protein